MRSAYLGHVLRQPWTPGLYTHIRHTKGCVEAPRANRASGATLLEGCGEGTVIGLRTRVAL